MGWKSTVDITREEALRIIYDRLEECDDEAISEILEEVLGGENHGHNYMIVKQERG